MAQEILKAFLLIFVAEMGDKTQILAMAFATRYPVKKVLLGIGIGVFLNHGLAVLLGSYLSKLIPINALQMVAGAAFVGFALWTLKPDENEDDEAEPKVRLGPIGTVALAFFLGELGDKTQLTAITLAADAQYATMILLGTVTGMVATGALGIFVGKKMGDRIPELGIKLFAASIFMLFGLQKLYKTIPANYLKPEYFVPFIIALAVALTLEIRGLLKQRKSAIQTSLKAKAKMLYDYYDHIDDDLDKICLGSTCCNSCKGSECAIGRAKALIDEARGEKSGKLYIDGIKESYDKKPFSKEQVYDCLADTLWVIDHIENQEELTYAHLIRRQMESILFGVSFGDYADVDEYIKGLSLEDDESARRIEKLYTLKKPIEERVINLGNSINNLYLIGIEDGYVLVDTGYREQYDDFRKKLAKHNINLDEIDYIFLTHAHDDHAGFLNQILEATKAKVILHPEAVNRLKTGQNSFEGGASSRLAWGFCRIMRLLGKGEHRYQPVDASDRYLIVNSANKEHLEALLGGKIIDLPGHTKDSIGLLFEKHILFSGDAAMNGLIGRHHIIIWVEDLIDYKKSWKKMVGLDCNVIYPSHGSPFKRQELSKNTSKLNKIKLYPLD